MEFSQNNLPAVNSIVHGQVCGRFVVLAIRPFPGSPSGEVGVQLKAITEDDSPYRGEMLMSLDAIKPAV